MLISVKDMSVDIFNKIKAWRNSPDAQKSINEMGESVDPNYLQEGIDETTKLFNAETKTIEGEGTLWEKVFGGPFKVVLKVVGILVAAAVAAFSVYDLVQDIRSGQPITKTVLDGVMRQRILLWWFVLWLSWLSHRWWPMFWVWSLLSLVPLSRLSKCL